MLHLVLLLTEDWAESVAGIVGAKLHCDGPFRHGAAALAHAASRRDHRCQMRRSASSTSALLISLTGILPRSGSAWRLPLDIHSCACCGCHQPGILSLQPVRTRGPAAPAPRPPLPVPTGR